MNSCFWFFENLRTKGNFTELQQHYELLHRQALDRIHSNGFEFDPLIDKPTDTRRGLTLVFRPDRTVLDTIQGFISKFKRIAPDHYFYRNPDIHVTVMPIISCYEGFALERLTILDYTQLISDCIADMPCFKVEFRGVFFSPSCIIIKGYPLTDTLENIRENLRREFSKVSLEQSLDKRYILRTAHSTIIRFKRPVQMPKLIEEFVESNTEFDFGISTINKVSFVHNDWYQRYEQVTVLKDYLLI